MNPRRHKNDTRTFRELTFAEQAKAMNMTALQFRKQLSAHLRRTEKDGKHDKEDVLRTRLGLLQSILEDFPEPHVKITFSGKISAPAVSQS